MTKEATGQQHHEGQLHGSQDSSINLLQSRISKTKADSSKQIFNKNRKEKKWLSNTYEIN